MFDYKQIPIEMRVESRWVLWKLLDGTKIPINALNGYNAKSNDNTTWTTFEVALANCEKYKCNGLGFMLGDGIFGVDLDHMLESEQHIVNEFITTLNSYTEVSQSGDGIHIICKGSLPKGRRRKGNIEMYDSARFFALTGNIIDAYTQLNECTESILPLYNKYLAEEKPTQVKPQANIDNLPPMTKKEIFDKVKYSKNAKAFNKLWRGEWEDLYLSQSDADLAFCSSLAFWTRKDKTLMDSIFRESGLMRDKWDVVHDPTLKRTYGQMTLDKAIATCSNVYEAQTQKTCKHYDFTDTGNAERFIDEYGEVVRYNVDNKYWMYYDGKCWSKDEKQNVKRMANELIVNMKKHLNTMPNEEDEDKILYKAFEKCIKHLSSSSGKEAMLKEAQALEGIAVKNQEFDQDKYLINVKNGIIDLKNNKMIPHDKKFMISKYINIECDTKNKPQRWLQFLEEVFESKNMINFIQKAVGYTLTGETKEQCFFQCYGDGSNGKSVFLDVVYDILGSYSLNSQVESILTKQSGGGANNDIARMAGARFIRTNEPNEGARFNEGLVKQLVGGDVTTARFLYGQEFEFKPCFKLWIATNYKIEVRGTDKGIWRRMRLIPFKASFEGEQIDRDLPTKLQAEYPQILGWFVKGCLKWQREGLGIPKEIEEEVKEYKTEMDVIASFIKDCVLTKKGKREKSTDVYNEYSKWAKDGHEYCMSKVKFKKEFKKRFEVKTSGGYDYYIDLILKKNDTTFVYERGDNSDIRKTDKHTTKTRGKL